MADWRDRRGHAVVSRNGFVPFAPLRREPEAVDIHDPKTWPRRNGFAEGLSPKAEASRALLLDQKHRLEKAIRDDAFPCTVAYARRMLVKVEWWLAQREMMLELAAGFMGPNGYGPAIDAVCRDSEHHLRINAEARGEAA